MRSSTGVQLRGLSCGSAPPDGVAGCEYRKRPSRGGDRGREHDEPAGEQSVCACRDRRLRSVAPEPCGVGGEGGHGLPPGVPERVGVLVGELVQVE